VVPALEECVVDRPTGATRRVLVVEDNLAIQTLLVEALSDEGYEVHSASDGSEALRGLRGWKPDLILLDVTLPEMDAAAFRAAQREFDQAASVPVLLVTGADGTSDLVDRLGAVGLVRKPFDLDELLGLVERALVVGAG
jgi:two-component system OmpR family response regulator